jgi:hypothetical protein
MIVELVGVTASGKSTAAPAIAAAQRCPLVRVDARPVRYALFVSHAVSHPRLTLSIARTIARETGFKPRLLLYKLKLLIGTFAKEEHASRTGGGVIDGGIFQYLFTIFEGPITAEDLARFESAVRGSDYLIYIFDISNEAWKRRIQARQSLPRPFLDKEAQVRWLDVATVNNAIIRSFLLERFRCVVVNDDAAQLQPLPKAG